MPQVIVTQCPKCQKSVAIDESGRCRECGSVIRSKPPRFDFLLAILTSVICLPFLLPVGFFEIVNWISGNYKLSWYSVLVNLGAIATSALIIFNLIHVCLNKDRR